MRFSWTTSDARVATVTSGGMVKAISEGTADILVRTVNVIDTARVTVKRVPSTVTLSDTEFVFTELAQSQTVSATVTDGGGQGLPRSDVVWSAANTTIATVGPTDLVTSVGQGTTTVRATAEVFSHFSRRSWPPARLRSK